MGVGRTRRWKNRWIGEEQVSGTGALAGVRGRRLGGIPLVVYVTVLLLIPLAALGFIGRSEVARNVSEARAAREVADTVEIQTAATNVLAPLQVERIALAGTARIDELGIDRDLVDAAIGTDFVAIRDDNAELLEQELDNLDEALAGADFDGADELRQRLGGARDDLEEVRGMVEEMVATPVDVVTVYDEFVSLVEDVIRASEADAEQSIPEFVDARKLTVEQAEASAILRTASREMVRIADTMIGIIPFDPEVLLLAGFAHDDALAEEIELVDPELTEELQAARAELSDYLDLWADQGVPTPMRIQIAPELYQDFARLLTERLAYLAEVEKFIRAVSTEIVEMSRGLADDADDDIRATIVAIGLIALAAFVFQLVVVRSFTTPMQRLRGGVEQIGQGILGIEPLPLRGPSDVRKVTGAVNDMASTLALVDQQVSMLASGDPAPEDVGDELPGQVGTSLRSSVERLAALTEDLKRSEERLQAEARRDGLTSLPNRFGVLEHLDAVLGDETSDPIALMIIDLDGFKTVNDTNGHDVGDAVLLEVAARARQAVAPDDVVARIGGDEFLVVVGDCRSTDRGIEIGRYLVDEIERPYRVGPLRLSLSASVGVKLVDPGTTALDALKQADAALYHAKQRGRGRVEMYDAALQASVERDAEIELALRRGVQEGELRLFLQPAADLETGLAYGAEALVRWDSSGVLRAPGEFIPVAERSGVIIEIGRWVLRHAGERLLEWERRDPGRPLRLAVNVSGRHLMYGGFLDDLDEVFHATGANPRLLEIELTESHLLDDVERVSELLAEVRSRGISVSVDDFGTGYSSMTYLRQFPLDLVKIDQAFTVGATQNRYDATVVESIVRLAAAMDLDVIAEGVETPEQLAFVRAQGIRKVQGFLIANPMPVEAAERLIFGGPLLDTTAVASDRRPGD